jgi:hypothetical protein
MASGLLLTPAFLVTRQVVELAFIELCLFICTYLCILGTLGLWVPNDTSLRLAGDEKETPTPLWIPHAMPVAMLQ